MGCEKGRDAVSKHTPGPWRRNTSPDWWANHPIYKHVGFAIVGNGIPYNGGDGEWEVCWFGKPENADPPDEIDHAYREREEADAHLIAAAPDYYDAVEAIAYLMPLSGGIALERFVRVSTDKFVALLAAHAKAKGETP